MKRLGITQRVDTMGSYGERRDCLDQRWVHFVLEIGFVPIPLPNVLPNRVSNVLAAIQPDAILFSGGNSIATLDTTLADAAPERDAFELELLAQSRQLCIPIVGVCRGMQLINLFFYGRLSPVGGHVACTHAVDVDETFQDDIPTVVNSFHRWGIAREDLAQPLIPIANDNRNHIEAFIHKTDPLLGIMWHPEREQPFNGKDIRLLQRFLR